MPNLPSGGTFSRGVSGFSRDDDYFSRKQHEELENIARRRRLLAQYNPSPRVSSQGAQPSNRPPPPSLKLYE